MSEQPNAVEYDNENQNFQQLREADKEKAKRIRELEGRLETIEPQYRQFVVERAGFQPDSPKAEALLKLHEDGELSVEALQQTAQKYELAGDASGDGQAPQPGQLSDSQKQEIAAAARAESTQTSGTPVEPQSLGDQIKAAEADAKQSGDWSEFDRLQTAYELSQA